LPFVQENKTPSWQTFHILLLKPLDQREIILKLKELGIGVNYGAQCMPEQTFYKNKYSYNSSEQFPNAFKAFVSGLAIPLYEKLTEKQVTKIIETINSL
jgi:dTDP-4-amino-4,6-dideoxygalactose transaminase